MLKELMHPSDDFIGVQFSCTLHKCMEVDSCSNGYLLSRLKCHGLPKLVNVNPDISSFSMERVTIEAGNKEKTKFVTLQNVERKVKFHEFFKTLEVSIRKFTSHHYRRI